MAEAEAEAEAETFFYRVRDECLCADVLKHNTSDAYLHK